MSSSDIQKRRRTERMIAKAGMAISLGVLTWSAMAGRQALRRYHPVAAVALLAFTAWHLTQYRPPGRTGCPPASPSEKPSIAQGEPR